MNVNIIIINMMHYIRSVEHTKAPIKGQHLHIENANMTTAKTTNENLRMINPAEGRRNKKSFAGQNQLYVQS